MKELAARFQGCKLLYVGRSANTVAHLCAKEALVSESGTTFVVLPGFLTVIVQSEKLPPTE